MINQQRTQEEQMGQAMIRIGVPKKGRSAALVKEVMGIFLAQLEEQGYKRDLIELVPIRMEDVPVDLGFGVDMETRQKVLIPARIDMAFYPIDKLSESKKVAEGNIPSSGKVFIEELGGSKTNIGNCSIAMLRKPETKLDDIQRVITTFPNVAMAYFAKMRPGKTLPEIIYREGGCEAIVAEGIAQCAIDVVETGSTAKSFGLTIEEIGLGSEFVVVTRNDFGINPNGGQRSNRVYMNYVGELIGEVSRKAMKRQSLSPRDGLMLTNGIFEMSETVWDRLLNPKEGSRVNKLADKNVKTIIGKLLEEVGELSPRTLALISDPAKAKLDEICDVAFMAVTQGLYARNLAIEQGIDLPQLFPKEVLQKSIQKLYVRNGVSAYDALSEAAMRQTQLVTEFKSAVQLVEGRDLAECKVELETINEIYSELQDACADTVNKIKNYLLIEDIRIESVAYIINGRNPSFNPAPVLTIGA